jgi:hypothetical protein
MEIKMQSSTISNGIYGTYFCNLKTGFRLSDWEKNLKYFDTIEVGETDFKKFKSIRAAIKANWIIKVTPEIELQFGHLFDTFGIDITPSSETVENIRKDLANDKNIVSNKNKKQNGLSIPVFNEDVNLASHIDADVIGNDIFDTNQELILSTQNDDSGIVDCEQTKFEGVDLGVSKESTVNNNVQAVKTLKSKPEFAIKAMKINKIVTKK